jgi:hypothetical protein
LAQQIATRYHPTRMYALISYFVGGLIVGGGAGMTVTLLTKRNVGDLISPYLHLQEKTVLKQSENLFEQEVNVVVLKKSLQKTVSEFQDVLLGIP